MSSKLKPVLPTNAVSVPHSKYIFRQKHGVCEAAFGADLAPAVGDKGLLQAFSNMQQLPQEVPQGRQKWPQQAQRSDVHGNDFVR